MPARREFPDLAGTLCDIPEHYPYAPGEDLSPFYTKNWGFNIYRTAYGPGSDGAWQTLVDDVRTQIRLQIEKRYKDELEIDAARKLMGLFRLSLHSDPTELQGTSLDRLRQIHTDNISAGRALANEDWVLNRVFFIANEEVVADVTTRDFWIKYVDVDYVDSENHQSRDPRVP